jgi:5-methylcytosine-specific restriction endonuclease McrA
MAERKWATKNPERQRALTKRWESENPDRIREIWRDMAARKRMSPSKRIHGRISNQIWQVIRGGKAHRHAFDLLGYSKAELISHLERQFLKGMGWENMGEWHIDHIVPLSSFTITGPDDPELRRAWALPNLRPLWAKDNIRKGAKIEVLL